MRKILDLGTIAADHSAEVSELVAAINGDAGRALWTSEMRPAVRGGKCTMMKRAEEENI